MKLLVTNDDGIASPFLRELVAALCRQGHEVFVVAPRVEQSWVGAAKTRNRPVRSAPADQGLGCPTWIVDGTHRLIFRLGEDVSPSGLRTDRAALAAGCISHTVLDYTCLGLA